MHVLIVFQPLLFPQDLLSVAPIMFVRKKHQQSVPLEVVHKLMVVMNVLKEQTQDAVEVGYVYFLVLI